MTQRERNKNIFALDIGGSTIDIVELCNTSKKILQKKSVESKNFPEKNLEEIIIFFELKKEIQKNKNIHLTGASAMNFTDYFMIDSVKICIHKVIEFESIARGGKFLSGKESGLVISLGTGTAMVAFEGEKWEHSKGTGIGGGTFLALGEALLGTKNFDKIASLVSKGNLKNIDLSVGEIAGGRLGILPADLTASNFAKYSTQSKKEDIALGIANLVAQSIALLALEKAQRLGLKNIIVGGKFSRLPYLVEKIKSTAEFFDVEIIVPENAGFMTTIGAGVSRRGKKALINI